MNIELAIVLFIIGIISLILFVSYGINEMKKQKKYKETLRSCILNNICGGVNYSTIKDKSLFLIAKKANNAGPNHCDVEFNVDLNKLKELKFSTDFILTSAKEG